MTRPQATPALPSGFTAVPGNIEHLEACADIVNACFDAEAGYRPSSPEYLLKEWTEPGLDLAHSARIVLDPKGRPVAYTLVSDHFSPPLSVRIRAHVHPDLQRRGLGTWLQSWADTRALEAIERCPPEARVTTYSWCFERASGRKAFFENLGMAQIRRFVRMEIDLSGDLAPAWDIEGITQRTYTEADFEATVKADMDAFRDHWGFIENPIEEEMDHWRHWIEHMEGGFDPGLWFLAEDQGQIAAVCLGTPQCEGAPDIGYVDSLGVCRPWRRRGIAQAMLLRLFEAFKARGKRSVCLDVDASSLTGATKLYEKVGMRVKRATLGYERVLREGKEMKTVVL